MNIILLSEIINILIIEIANKKKKPSAGIELATFALMFESEIKIEFKYSYKKFTITL